MKDDLDRDLLRLLTGELDAERQRVLERALEGDAELRRRYEEWRQLWRGLELPSPEPSDDLVRGVRRRLAAATSPGSEEADLRELWRLTSVWGRALATASLAAGVALGVWLGQSTVTEDDVGLFESFEPTLSESYWTESNWTGSDGSGDDSTDSEGAGGDETGSPETGRQPIGSASPPSGTPAAEEGR